MITLHFDSDYMEGAHPQILRRLLETNMEKTPGYGLDEYCDSARRKIRQACDCPRAEVYFLVGGTQTNKTVIDGLLPPYAGVIAASSGHVSVHEAGAIEATGHKVLTLPPHDGKVDADELLSYLQAFYADDTHDHMPQPGLVYISHPSESGSLYSAAELLRLREICDQYQLPLFLDGARLGYGLMARNTDVDLPLLARCCDVFYIGGTKVGALFGEAVVIPRPGQLPHFFTLMKQNGALLAKGRLLGLQFDTLFSDGLYFEISLHAIDMAEQLEQAFMEKGYRLYYDSPTNQKFVLLDNAKLAELARQVSFSVWEKPDAGHTVVRFATSWATQPEDIAALRRLL